ncbi:hypothetical protein [Bogoriella caseilytica]|uniref:hypothetical protein n=1 Tax=Bogoriella caseilytica TaxID=56055 RepID=UPI0011CD510D|nr:hypothetical protein [Bogoriella caseilytica]
MNPTAAEAMPVATVLIAEETISSAQAEVVFDDIEDDVPDDARHLILEISAAAVGGGNEPVQVEAVFNSDEDANYLERELFGIGETLDTEVRFDQNSAGLMPVPAAGGDRFGGGRSTIPWAFVTDQSKHVLSQGAANEDHISATMAHWEPHEAINSITLRLDAEGSAFAPGSRLQLFAVDESYAVAEDALEEDAPSLEFPDLPQDLHDLVVIGQTRSSEHNVNRRGDRVWSAINSDSEGSNYRVQRITGEALTYRPDREHEEDRLVFDQLGEPRVGWNTAAAAPEGIFGPWMVHYADYTNTSVWNTYRSQHGTRDEHFNPVGQEVGRWTQLSSLQDIEYFPQRGSNFVAGSRAVIYGAADPISRHEIPAGGANAVHLQIPSGAESLQVHISARSENEDENDDRLIIEANGDDNPWNYRRQRMSAYDGAGEAARGADNQVGILPAASMPTELVSATELRLDGLDSGRELAVVSYGGIPGDGRVALYGGRWLASEEVRWLTLRTESGADLAEGGVVTVSAGYLDQGAASLGIPVVELSIVLAVIVVGVLVLKRFAGRAKWKSPLPRRSHPRHRAP